MVARRDAGLAVDEEALIASWERRAAGCADGLRRYPWFLSYERWIDPPPYASEPEAWQPWRRQPAKALDKKRRLAYWFATPVCTCVNGELLADRAAAGDLTAHALLVKTAPVMRKDFASYIAALHPWSDTFALWNLTRAGRLLDQLHPLAFALAMTLSAAAKGTGDAVVGEGYPYYNVPLASASAQLASCLLALGTETALVARLLEFLASSSRPSGAWGDGKDPEDILTTLVVADLLSSVDPSYRPDSAAAFLVQRQEASGGWRALGPELPWLTGQVLRWLARVPLRFALRFRWPRLSEATMDSKTRLPGYAYFQVLIDLCSGLPGLARSSLDMAFLDLAAFKRFNDQYGQERGDEVIVLLAQTLSELPDARAIRDGGDEFLIVGTPTDDQLEGRLRSFLASWPAIFRERFGDSGDVVAPRICLATGPSGSLRALREMLGRAITELKREVPSPGAAGCLRRIR